MAYTAIAKLVETHDLASAILHDLIYTVVLVPCMVPEVLVATTVWY
jgi:hypothetical protein